MDILTSTTFPVAEFYLVFFGASLLILGMIVLSLLPSWIRQCLQAIRFLKARRSRGERTIATLEDLERAGADLEGAMLFDEEEVFS